jgi:hypothetical protein
MKARTIRISVFIISFSLLNYYLSAQSISAALITHYSKAQVDSIFSANQIPLIQATYALDLYKEVYNTVNADSTPTIASGLLIIPEGTPCKTPLASYQHGTILDRNDVPSNLESEDVIGIVMATNGITSILPDYLGMGSSPGLHPYIIADPSAVAVADMIRATIPLMSSMAEGWNTQLFLVGYSEGGYVTMAAHRFIQKHYYNQFRVTASAPMSGPYDVSGVQADVITADSTYPDPGYLPYILFAYNSVYHLYNSPSQFLASPYDTLLPKFFTDTTTYSLGDVNALCPSVPNKILPESLLDSFRNDKKFRFTKVLAQNNVYAWLPKCPVRMFYCDGDHDVNFMNTIVAYDTMKALGDTNVSISDGGDLAHYPCAQPSLLEGYLWFQTFRKDLVSITFNVKSATGTGNADGSATATIYGGFKPYTYLWSNSGTDSSIVNVIPGKYFVSITDSIGCVYTDSVIIGTFTSVSLEQLKQVKIFPNPASNYLSIQFPSIANNILFSLFDINGHLLQSAEIKNNQTQIPLDHLSSGIYQIELQDSYGNEVVRKIVKM